MSLINKFLTEYKNLFPHGNINSKDYKTTIVRNIMIYFLYKSYKNKYIKREDIINSFEIKHKTNIYNKVNYIKNYINAPQTLSKEKLLFSHFYYKFKKIYVNYENKN